MRLLFRLGFCTRLTLRLEWDTWLPASGPFPVMLQRLAMVKIPLLSVFPIEHMLTQCGIEFFEFEAVGMILPIFLRVVIVRTLRTFHFDEHAVALSLGHGDLQYLCLNHQHAAEWKGRIYSVARIISRILYRKHPVGKMTPICYHAPLIIHFNTPQ